MEEVFDIFQVCGPLLLCCWIVAHPPPLLPTWTRLEHYSWKPLFPLVFIYLFIFLIPSLNSNPSSRTPLLKTAPHPPPTPFSPSPAYCLSCSLDMRSSVWLAEAERRSALEETGNQRHTAAIFPNRRKNNTGKTRGSEGDTGVSGSAFFPFANPRPHSHLLAVCLGLSTDFSHWLPASAGWVRWLWDHYLLPGDLERYKDLLPNLLLSEPVKGNFTRRRSRSFNLCDRDTGGHLWTKTSNSIRDYMLEGWAGKQTGQVFFFHENLKLDC